MISDRKIAHAYGLGGHGHLFDAVSTIGINCVAVRHAANIGKLYRLREFAGAGDFNLTFIFAHLRRDVLNAEPPVDFVFAVSGWPISVTTWLGIQRHRFRAR